MRIINCKLHHLSEPLAYQLDHTSFSWQVTESRGKKQEAARIVVRLGAKTVADTGMAALDSLGTKLAFELKPRARYTWTVRVRTDAGEEAESDVNSFETGKLDEPWAAKWISCDSKEPRHPIFTKRVLPQKSVASARLYVCGLGLFEASFNGQKIGGEYLAPYFCDYRNWLQYRTYDVGGLVKDGGELSILLGNGWYKGRIGFVSQTEPFFGREWLLLAELRIKYADGSEEVIGTDESWQVTRSAITFSNIYDGEWRDDTLEALPAVNAYAAKAPEAPLLAAKSLPVTAHETFPAEIIHTPAGETVLDIGQNISGIFRLRVREKRGAKIHLQFGEVMQNGCFYRDNLRSAKAEYFYVCDGNEKTIEPKFTFYGFRYVKIEGTEHFEKGDFTALALYSDMPQRGWVTTGNALVNKLVQNTRWGMKDNFVDIPTDCPQRDERMGWTGDSEVFSETALYLADPVAFYMKYLYDIAEEQKVWGGIVPDYVPFVGNVPSCSSAWGDAATVMPWNMYLFSGDKSILEDQFDSMKAWVDYLTEIDGDDHAWRTHHHYGDWLALDSPYGGVEQVRGGTDEGFIADVYYRKSALLTASAARVLGKTDEAEKYEKLAARILEGIRDEYFSKTGRCCIATQTAALLTLSENLHDPEKAEQALRKQLDISGGKLRTGFVGTPLLCRVLSEHGMADKAFELLLNEDYPGWLNEIKLGATTVWERWNSLDQNGMISSTGMNSLNHYSYGAVVAWIFNSAAGLRPREDAPGFVSAVIKPCVSKRLGALDMSYDSSAGKYRVAWKVEGDRRVILDVSVPFGCEALLSLPLSDEEPKTLGAGDYHFEYETADAIS